MRQNRRRTGSRRSADDKIKYMRMAAIPLVIVLVLVAVILVMDRKPSDKEASLMLFTLITPSGRSCAVSEQESLVPLPP